MKKKSNIAATTTTFFRVPLLLWTMLACDNNSNCSSSITSLSIMVVWAPGLDTFVYSTRLYPEAETRSCEANQTKHALGHEHTNLKNVQTACYKHIIKNLEISGLCTPDGTKKFSLLLASTSERESNAILFFLYNY